MINLQVPLHTASLQPPNDALNPHLQFPVAISLGINFRIYTKVWSPHLRSK